MNDYNEHKMIAITIKQRELLKSLPPFVAKYFRGIENITAPTTRLAYANDLKTFFKYLLSYEEDFKCIEMQNFTIYHLNIVNIDHLESYIDFIAYYSSFSKSKNGTSKNLVNKERGKSRKIASIRTLFKYHFKRQLIDSNPADLLLLPKIHNKAIVRLEPHEVSILLDEVENGNHLTPSQKKYHHITKKRDMALISLLLGTGMRVSECVGIDIRHINFDNNSVLITRKGGDEVTLYFGNEVRNALVDYLNSRTDHDSNNHLPLFLSIQKKRINIRTVQNLVKKYSSAVISTKNISPHKLRSTFGTNLYNQSGDIYLVADALGHTDVNTTKKHYANIEEEKRKSAPTFITLRE